MARFCAFALVLFLLSPRMAMAEPTEFSCTPKQWCHITLNKQVCGDYTIGRMAKRLLFIADQGVWLDTLKHAINPNDDGGATSMHFTATHQFPADAAEGGAAGEKRALLYKHDGKLISKVTTHEQTDVSVFECRAME